MFDAYEEFFRGQKRRKMAICYIENYYFAIMEWKFHSVAVLAVLRNNGYSSGAAGSDSESHSSAFHHSLRMEFNFMVYSAALAERKFCCIQLCVVFLIFDAERRELEAIINDVGLEGWNNNSKIKRVKNPKN